MKDISKNIEDFFCLPNCIRFIVVATFLIDVLHAILVQVFSGSFITIFEYHLYIKVSFDKFLVDCFCFIPWSFVIAGCLFGIFENLMMFIKFLNKMFCRTNKQLQSKVL